jgi:hypothetical protein
MMGGEVFDFAPGHSPLTTVDLPVISHVSSATASEPFLGLLLTIDARAVLQVPEEMGLPRPPGQLAHHPISLEPVDGALFDALARLVRLIG